ncbi:23363_t:CDS:2, partial [Gigaspora rosea]
GLTKGKLDELQQPILKLAKTKAELATTTANREALKRQVSFKPKSIEWEVKGEDNKTLATWSQLKLIKSASSKGRKPVWFERLESLLLQNPVAREIKNDLYINADLKGLAIPNLQSLSADKRINDWVITKEMDRTGLCGSGPKQTRKVALESSSKTTKIKTNLWQSVQNQQQSNHESVLRELIYIEWPEIKLIQNQYFNNKLSLQLTEELRCNVYRNKETYHFYTDGSLFETAPNETKDLAMGAAWVQVDENKTNSSNKACVEPETGHLQQSWNY